jgi:hypothetical protein
MTCFERFDFELCTYNYKESYRKAKTDAISKNTQQPTMDTNHG